MGSYIIRKLLYGIAVLWGVATLVFFLFNILPGDPAQMMLGQRADEASVNAIREELGLNQSLGKQYVDYLNDLGIVVTPASTGWPVATGTAKGTYTADDLNYFDNKARSMTEMKDNNIRPAIAALPEDLSQYDTIWLGYPIWGGQAPKIMYTFLENVDLAGKTIIPFCTSNSSGIGSSATNLQKVTGEDVKWEKGGRVKKGDNAEAIAEWIKSIIQN